MPESSGRPPDWQRPAGVGPGLWEYLHSAQLASNYEAQLQDSPLRELDQRFILAQLPAEGLVLDLGCGSGRHLAPLAQRGLEVIGIDLSEPMLGVAAEKLSRAGLPTPLVRANLVELDCIATGSVSACLCMFSTLGLIEGQGPQEQFIRHVHRILQPGGRFLLHVHNRWHALWTPGQRSWFLRDILRAWSGHPEAGDVVMPFHQGVANLRMHLFTRGELVRLLEHAEFTVEALEFVGHGDDGSLARPSWFGGVRAQGFLVAARR
jgi:SAM-dependent methyltransferase